MPRDLSRLLRPNSVALFGGGWAANVIAQLKKSGYAGEIWPVHPTRTEIGGVACYHSLADLPSAPDASFIGINREATIDLVRELASMGAGGATCFASGFRESEDTGGSDLQQALVEAAGDMPILGPNCYGFLNYLDNVAFWPDQHGGLTCGKGVGIIAQSSNIAINMTMQRRNLPIGMLVAAGNQAQTGIADIASAMLADERITAIGLYLEGFGDIRELEAFAARARKAGKPVVVIKTGKSESARKAAITHTASMSGSATFASALFRRLAFAQVDDVETFLEVLKLLHHLGPLNGDAVVSVSCSGGEAGLIADMANETAIRFRGISQPSSVTLRELLGPIVTITNPLDYHTFIWGNTRRMTEVFCAVMADRHDLCVFVLDVPRDDRCEPSSFRCAVDAIIAARQQTGANVAVISLLPENLSEKLGEEFAANGVVPLNGMATAVAAIDAAIRCGARNRNIHGQRPLAFTKPGGETRVLDEKSSKARLAEYGLKVPNSASGSDRQALIDAADKSLAFPVVLKASGIAHKSEAGGVMLNLADRKALEAAFAKIAKADNYLVEEMATGGLAELIIGVSREDDGLLMLTIGAGGIFTEILNDAVHLLLPANPIEIEEGLRSLRTWPMLDGYRGRPKADLTELISSIIAISEMAMADDGRELDVNPLIVREKDVIVADALVIE